MTLPERRRATCDAWRRISKPERPVRPKQLARRTIDRRRRATAYRRTLTIDGRRRIDLVSVQARHHARLHDATTTPTLMNPKVLVGMFLGAMATFVFCAMTMKAVGRAAYGMVEEVRRQFREKPGHHGLAPRSPTTPRPVAISTKAAQREMILPSLLGLATPVVAGLAAGRGRRDGPAGRAR